MVGLLIRKFVKNYQDTDSAKVRYAVGRLCGYVGIVLNLILFASKYAVGFIVNSVSIKADAVNNLTDAVNNIVSIVSFHLSEKPADKEHPYGHERTETITTLFMGLLIGYFGIEMVRQSIEKILHNTAPVFEWSSVIVLCFSIVIKLIMFSYNNKYGNMYHSELLHANAVDSRNDILGTTLVLISAIISPWIHYDLDGAVGLVVAVFILWSAYGILKEVINRLLGEAPSTEKMNELTDNILSDPIVLDVHDIVFHSYGPSKVYATAHAEVDGALNLVDVHSSIDAIERWVQKCMDIDLVIHVDPVLLNDNETIELADDFEIAIEKVDPDWTMHDFRVENRDENTREVFFDLVVPYTEHRDLKDIDKLILEKADFKDGKTYILTVRIEHPYS